MTNQWQGDIIPGWAIIKALKMRKQGVKKVTQIVWGIGLLLAVQALALLEWAR
jgi:hypothetical protein